MWGWGGMGTGFVAPCAAVNHRRAPPLCTAVHRRPRLQQRPPEVNHTYMGKRGKRPERRRERRGKKRGEGTCLPPLPVRRRRWSAAAAGAPPPLVRRRLFFRPQCSPLPSCAIWVEEAVRVGGGGGMEWVVRWHLRVILVQVLGYF